MDTLIESTSGSSQPSVVSSPGPVISTLPVASPAPPAPSPAPPRRAAPTPKPPPPPSSGSESESGAADPAASAALRASSAGDMVEEWASLAPELRPHAANLSASLPSEVIVAREIVTTLGHTEERAAQLLERFVGYLRTQHALITSAALTDTWTPRDGTPDRTQKTVRGLAHATKGAAEMVMARRVARTSRLLQNACEELRADAPSDEARYTASAAVEVWKCEVDRLLDALKGRDLGQLVRSKRPIYVRPASHAAQPKSAAAAMRQPAVVQSTPLTAEALSANARVEA